MKKFSIFLCAMLLILGTSGVVGATEYYEYYEATAYQSTYDATFQWMYEGDSYDFGIDMPLTTGNDTDAPDMAIANDVVAGFGLYPHEAYVKVGVFSIDPEHEAATLTLTAYGPLNDSWVLYDGIFNFQAPDPYGTGVFWLDDTQLASFQGDQWGNINVVASNIEGENDWGLTEIGFGMTVPEPATMLLIGSALLGLAGFSRRFRKR